MTEVQYITNANGQRTSVILPIEEYDVLLDAAGLTTATDAIEDSEEDIDLRLAKIMELTHSEARVPQEEIFASLRRES